MAVLSSDLIRQGAAGASTGYTIKNSIRFNDDDNAYLTRTVSSASNRKTFTISWWWKFGEPGSIKGDSHQLWNSYSDNNNRFSIMIDNDVGTGAAGDKFCIFNITGGSTVEILETNRLFRDVSAWYHFVVAVDTTQDVAEERVKLFVNGDRETSFSEKATIGQNVDTAWNLDCAHGYGAYLGGTTGDKADGYMAECHHVDGYAYGPEYFGQIQEDTNIWVPIKYGSSYGTNGFYIKGSNSGSLGADSSGNGNNFTATNFQANDQKIDTPTNNQITFNPLNNQQSGGTPSNGNLDYEGPGTRTMISLTANIPSTGKWAIAFKVAAVSTNNGWNFGITKATNDNFGDAAGSNEDVGASDGINMNPSSSDLSLYDYVNSTAIDPSLPITTSDEFWIAVDMATGKVFLGIYDESATTMKFVAADTGLDGNPATGDNPTTTISDMIGSDEYTFAVGSKDTSNDIYLQRSTDVSGTTPSGYTYFENVKDLL